MILSLIWSFSRNRFQNDENLFNTPIFELYIFIYEYLDSRGGNFRNGSPNGSEIIISPIARGKLRFRRQSKEKWSYREIAKLTSAVR